MEGCAGQLLRGPMTTEIPMMTSTLVIINNFIIVSYCAVPESKAFLCLNIDFPETDIVDPQISTKNREKSPFKAVCWCVFPGELEYRKNGTEE